jgi:dsDNA-specific endonuclease/ATPase MutS2
MSLMLWLLATIVLLLGLAWLGRRFLQPRQEQEVPDAVPLEPLETGSLGDELDLHGVPPKQVAELVDAFIDDAYSRDERLVRIIHGRGIGVLRRLVRSRLARHPRVVSFGDAPPPSGWGATVAELSSRSTDVEPSSTSD